MESIESDVDFKDPHDTFFKSAMSNVKVATEFFEHHLTPDFLGRLNLATLIPIPTNFSRHLKRRLSDIIYGVEIDNKPGYLYLLVEHQRKADKMMPFRILEYSIDIMRWHLKQQKCHELPVVIPIVYYNGKDPYVYSTDLFQLFGDQTEHAKSTILQPFQLIDLSQIKDEQLRERSRVSVMNLLMKNFDLRDPILMIELAFKEILELKEFEEIEFLRVCVYYITATGSPDWCYEDVNILLEEAVAMAEQSTELGRPSMIERLREQGRLKGIEQGLGQGLDQGKRQGDEMARRQIAHDLLKQGVDPRIIERATRLTLNQINEIDIESD